MLKKIFSINLFSTKSLIKKVFDLQDNDNNKSLHFSEIIIISNDPNKIMEFYSKGDKNKDQKITLEEYYELMKRENVSLLYSWLKKNSTKISMIKNNWIKTLNETENGSYNLNTPMYYEEVFRVLQYLELSHSQLSSLHQYLDKQKLFAHAYVHYGELMSLVCTYLL